MIFKDFLLQTFNGSNIRHDVTFFLLFLSKEQFLFSQKPQKAKEKHQYIDPSNGFQCYPSFRRCPVTEKHFSQRRVQTDLM